MALPQVLHYYSLGCLPWGTALPGAGSDLHVVHIQNPTKANWQHTTPVTYTRKKVWSAASAQLLHDPRAPPGTSVGERQEKEQPFRAHAEQKGEPQGLPAAFLPSRDLHLVNVWARPAVGHLELKKDSAREAPKAQGHLGGIRSHPSL